MDKTPAPLLAAMAAPESISFSYVPRSGLGKLTLVNFLLNLITLGFYRFWAKTNVRKHIWSCVYINGEPLEYTGRGMELFKGFLVVFFVLGLPLALLYGGIMLYAGPESPLLAIPQVFIALVVYVLWGFAVYKARRYQLSRTNWRGIRGTLVGSAMIYSLLYFGSLLAKGMSMGWATPVMNTVLQEQITNDMRFGDAAFKFKGRAGPLYPTYALCWLLSLGAIIAAAIGIGMAFAESAWLRDLFQNAEAEGNPKKVLQVVAFGLFAVFIAFAVIIPMLWAVYTAKELRTFADYTRFDGCQFRLDARAGSVIGLAVVNVLLIIFTLGIAWPFVHQRLVRYVVDRLTLEGKIDIDRIGQSRDKMDTRGEGLADAFDVGGL